MVLSTSSLVTTAKEGVELGRVLPADTLSPILQLTQRFEGYAETFCSHGRGAWLKVLISETKRGFAFNF